MDKIKHIILAAIVGLTVGFCIGLWQPDRQNTVEIKEVIKYRDTSYSRLDLNKPISLLKTPVSRVPHVYYFPVNDTSVIIKDSIRYIMLDREFKFLNKDNIDIWYSGIDPTIDSLHVRHSEKTITQTISASPRKWSINVFTGADLGKTFDCQYITPNIGAELNYNKWTFGASAGFSREIKEQTQLAPYVELNLKYNIFSTGR